jgi:hypothetical protein
MVFLGHLGTPKWTQKVTQRSTSGQDVWPNVLARKGAPSQNNRPIIVREMVQNNKKTVFLCCLGHLNTPKWTQKGTQRPGTGQDVQPNVLA